MTTATTSSVRTPQRLLESIQLGFFLVALCAGNFSVAISQISAGRKNSVQWEVDGAASAAAWDSETPDHLWIGHRGRPNEIMQRGAELMNQTGTAATALPGGHIEGFADTLYAHFREVYRAILAGQAPADPLYATFEAGHHEMTVGDAVAQSAAEDRWVDVAD